MNIINIATEVGTDISSRSRASKLRAQIEELVQHGEVVVLDFSGVRTISESFADELFRVLIEDHSELWFSQHVELRNVGTYPRKAILTAIADKGIPA